MDIKLPNLGEGIDSGVVVSLLVKEGDSVTEGQNLIELETGKAVAGIPASASGVVQKVRVKEGDKISPGAVLVSLSSGGTPAATVAAPSTAKVVEPEAAPVPKAAPVPAQEVEDEEEPAVAIVDSTDQYFAPPASPTIRKLARDLGIDLRRIKGSEHGGRIVLNDLRRYIQRLIKAEQSSKLAPAAAQKTQAAVPAPVSIDFSQWGPVNKKPMSPLRQVIAKRMVESVVTVPQVTQFEDVDISGLLDLRKKYAAAYESNGAKLTVTGFVVKALVAMLQKHAVFNASIDETTQEIVLKQYYHIGMAVDTEAGLLVPVIRDADKKSILDISRELVQIAEKARSRKLGMDEMQGGTCSISNQGAIGGGHFTPIVNKPEVAILGVGKSAVKPVWSAAGKVEPKTIMPLALSYDHRLIDGGNAARFIADLRMYFESFPEELVKL